MDTQKTAKYSRGNGLQSLLCPSPPLSLSVCAWLLVQTILFLTASVHANDPIFVCVIILMIIMILFFH